ncbi:MAG: hypothetical protein K5892_07500 [Acholeplasmatales bacterium]|nr:hypothetical protein [Acholeplasmatales bacterium]
MGQKTNYFKSYFKGYGIFSTLLVAIIYGVLGYFVYKSTNVLGPNVTDIVYGALMASLIGFAVIGLTSIKSEKIGLLDFLRVSGLISSIVVLVMVLLAKETSSKTMIVYIVLAVVFLAEIIVRFIYSNDAEPVSSKNYYGSLAGKYNPIIILVLGVAAAVGLYFVAKEGLWDLGATVINNKYLLLGGALLLGIVALISALDRNAETTLFDFGCAVFFVGALYFLFIGAGVVSVPVLKLVLLFFGLFGGILLVRGFTYNKDKAYPNSSHKVRTYFLQTYNTFSIPCAVLVALAVIFAFAVPAAKLVPGNSIAALFGSVKDSTITILSVVAIVISVILIVLTLVLRKFKSTKIEKVDFVLVAMLLAGTFAVPYVLVTVIGDNFSVLTDNIVLLIAFIALALMFVYGAILQIVRLRSYDPLLAVVAQAEQQKQAEQAKEEENTFVEEEKAEEPKQEEEEKDPFALSEEDEKIYEEVYGKDETEEEPQEEVVEEEVVEEEPQEEEIVEEEVVEEEPQEEVQEEQPEEVVEQASEETEAEADDEEADDEEEDEDDDDDEEAEEEVEEKPEHVKTKEEQIITQDFQIVDQNTGEVKKIKRRFISKMMYAPYETKEYYNEIKNTLLSYRCKPRQSSRYETYRYKGLIAKVTLGGKAIKVYLALDPTFVEENPKYHLKDMSAKKQYKDVPVMIRVKSDRALKYFKEIVEILMTNRGVKPKKNFEAQNYMGDLIPNGEAIMATLGMSNDYLVDSINVKSIPEDMPDDLANYLPMIPGEPLDEPEKVAAIYLDTLNNHFVDGAEITLDVLKSLNILKTGNTLKIKARGTLDKKLRIYAEYFDADALKMILCTSGTAIKIVRDQASIDQIVDEIPEEEQGTYNDAPVERQAQPEEASDDVVEEAPVQDEAVEDVANEEAPAEEVQEEQPEEVVEEAQEDAAPETDENGDVVVYQDDDGNYVDSNGNPFTEEQLREFGLIEDDSNE